MSEQYPGESAVKAYPQLESLELRRVSELTVVPPMDNASPNWISQKLETDSVFKDRVVKLEQGYDELARDGELTNDRILSMLRYQFFDDAIARGVAMMPTWQAPPEHENNFLGTSYLTDEDALFCEYLEMALPLSLTESDEALGLNWWDDYVLNEVIQRIDYGEPEASTIVTPEERVAALRKAHMDDAREYVKRTLAIAGVGVAALLGAEFVVPHVTDVQAVQDTLHTGGLITTGFAGLRFLALASRLAYGYEDRQKLAKRLQYPAFDMSNLADSRTLLAADSIRSSRELRASYPYETSWKGSADSHALETVVTFVDHLIGGGQQNIDIFCDTVARRMDTYLSLDPEDNYDKRVADQIFRLLDQHLPIYESDTVVPRNELTGEKTWRCFVTKYLAAQKATDSKE